LVLDADCRQLADVFNRLHLRNCYLSVSKSFMAYVLRTRWHAVLLKRREIRAHVFRKVRIDTAVKPQWGDPVTGQLTVTSPVDTVY